MRGQTRERHSVEEKIRIFLASLLNVVPSAAETNGEVIPGLSFAPSQQIKQSGKAEHTNVSSFRPDWSTSSTSWRRSPDGNAR